MEQTTITEQRILTPGALTPGQLAAEVQRLTSSPADWVARVRLDPEGRWYERIQMTDDFEVWLISWLPGQSTGFHDHGVSAGAFGVVWGALDESVATRRGAGAPRAKRVTAGDVRSFGPHYVHDVQNSSTGSVAVSVHAYSPPLSSMTRYNVTSGGLAVAGAGRGRRLVNGRPAGARSIEEILASARRRLDRITPGQAYAELCAGATLIDIRPAAQRAEHGEIPGSVVIERNHLEWRLDPGGDARLPWAAGYDLRPMVICNEGYTSSLAAAALQDLGLLRATDVIGGYQAWRAEGLPTARPEQRAVVLAPGAGPAYARVEELRDGGRCSA